MTRDFAHELLDSVKAGVDVSPEMIRRALVETGDLARHRRDEVGEPSRFNAFAPARVFGPQEAIS